VNQIENKIESFEKSNVYSLFVYELLWKKLKEYSRIRIQLHNKIFIISKRELKKERESP
jgi:hypothetical protein